ncbi:hypothetical protein PFISCL1PPCAC_16315 [Pristionchus fissidentatus]|uniref:Uncharacterized protein n=1 Tax=Pristionchus fissidentatus TaxID=1538716 RepID=A0AAV5W3H0_9BILA|nr:hypothetical protein PFISCL1PPCAC_16315 [Pristionchus fissidentatus]
MVLHKKLIKLKRSISEKFLSKACKEEKRTEEPSQDESIDRDPYKEMLRLNSDNVSHLVLHGSSLRQLHSLHDLSSYSPSSHKSSNTSTESADSAADSSIISTVSDTSSTSSSSSSKSSMSFS